MAAGCFASLVGIFVPNTFLADQQRPVPSVAVNLVDSAFHDGENRTATKRLLIFDATADILEINHFRILLGWLSRQPTIGKSKKTFQQFLEKLSGGHVQLPYGILR